MTTASGVPAPALSSLRTLREDEHIGALHSLGSDAIEYLLNWVGADPRYPSERLPGTGVFAAFLGTATTMVEEAYYFDLDYRSEVAILIDSSFQPLSTNTARLHFFSAPVDPAGERIHDYVERAASD